MNKRKSENDITFSDGISDEMRMATRELFAWGSRLSDLPSGDKVLPPALQRKVEAGLIDVEARGQFELTPLHIATHFAGVEAVQSLLDHGADLTAICSIHGTPLHGAVMVGADPSVIQCLLDNGANKDEQNPWGKTPLHFATYGSNNHETIKCLIDNGANVNAQNEACDETPLHEAVRRKHGEVIQLLIDHGADINLRNRRGHTPVLLARSDNQDGVLAVLIQNGANIHAEDIDGKTIKDTLYENPYPIGDMTTWNAWHDKTLSPAELTKDHVMQLLSVWPLADPQAPVPHFEHLEAIFSDERWNEVDPQQKLDLIKEIPGISNREQMYLLGGNAARVLRQQQAQNQQTSRGG